MKLVIFILSGMFAASVCIAQEKNTVTDADGNVYHTVKIGNQVWTVENLRTTKYNDNTPIALDTLAINWAKGISGEYCYFKNTTNKDSIKKYGALYNWYAVDTKKLAPPGWRVPMNEDWAHLISYLVNNGYNWDGTKIGNKCAKSLAAQSDWQTDKTPGAVGCDLSKNNQSGFSALPGGFRFYGGNFDPFGILGSWWSATDDKEYNHASCYQIYSDYYNFEWLYCTWNSGNSVRLIRN